MSNIWHVQAPDGKVRTLSLDELDEAFQNGSIDENTLVLPAGAINWARLGDVAGLDEESETPPPVSTVNSVAPIALDLAPIAARLDADLDAPPELRPRRRGRVVAMLGVPLVLGALGVAAFTKYGGAASTATQAAAAAAAQEVKASAAVLPAAAAAAQGPAPVMLDPGRTPLTEQQKQALAEQDKAREAARANRKAKQPPPARRPTKSGNPFVKNGNKYDPLNSSL
jgi:hypothetical protein